MHFPLFEPHTIGSKIKHENSLTRMDIDEWAKVFLQDLFNTNNFYYWLTWNWSSSLVYTMRERYWWIIPAVRKSPYLLKKRRHGQVNYVTEMLMAIGINDQIWKLLEQDHHTRIVLPIFANEEISIVPKISGNHIPLFTNTTLAVGKSFDSIRKNSNYWKGRDADLHTYNIIEWKDWWRYIIDF
jgi:hypothetical protein